MEKMIVIIDYKAGNLKSVERALKKLGFACRITHDREAVLNAERIIFPGVGAAGKALADLKHFGLDKALTRSFKEGTPILGICLGAQIVLEKSEENSTQCLGLIGGDVMRFPSPLFSVDKDRLKIPHMGWNRVKRVRRHLVLEGIRSQDEFYFVHSYYPMPSADHHIIGTTDYGIEFPSIIGHNNLIAMQFHLEKSGPPGLRILKNFCTWNGKI